MELLQKKIPVLNARLTVLQLCFLLAGIGAIGVLIFNALDFFNAVFANYPRSDDYRLILFHIRPWLTETWSPALLWQDVHPAPLLGIAYIFSTVVDGLTFASWWYAIAAALVLKWLCFIVLVYKNSQLSAIRMMTVAVGFALVVFSLNTTAHFTWNLVGFGLFYSALAASYLTLVYHWSENNNLRKFCLLLLATLLFQLVIRSISIFWLAGILISLGLNFIARRGSDNRVFAQYAGLIVLVLLFDLLFYKLLGIELYFESRTGSAISNLLVAWLHRPWELLLYICVSLASGLVNFAYFAKQGINDVQIMWISLAYGVVYFFCIGIAIWNIKQTRYQVALTLLLFPLLTLVAVICFRTGVHTRWSSGGWPRYVPIRDIGALGVIWVLFEFAADSRLGRSVQTCVNAVGLLFLTAATALYIEYSGYNWNNRLPSINKFDALNRQQVVFAGEAIARDQSLTGAQIKQLYEDHYGVRYSDLARTDIGPRKLKQNHKLQALLLLKQNNLNVFRQ